MTDFIEVDFQEIVFGSEPQRDRIQVTDRLLSGGDAPTRLMDQQLDEINKYPKSLKLKQKKHQAARSIKKMKLTVQTGPKPEKVDSFYKNIPSGLVLSIVYGRHYHQRL